MITATGLELRVGSRLLLGDATFRIAPGDRVGLVGRNGAGKTTLTRVLSGETPARGRRGDPLGTGRLPAAGPADRRPRRARPRPDPFGPRPGRGHRARCAPPRARWPAPTRRPTTGRCAATCASRRSSRQPAGTPPRARPRRSRPRLGLPDRVLGPAAAHALRRPAAPGRAVPDPVLEQRVGCRLCCSTSRPTTSTPTRSSGCATTCKAYKGGLVVISHDVGLLEHAVNRVFHLDANRAEMDIYNVGWKAYLTQRETDERRRKRERANVEKQASVLKAQADRMRYKATKARGGAEHGQAGGQAARPGSRRCGATTRSPSCASRSPRRAARRR